MIPQFDSQDAAKVAAFRVDSRQPQNSYGYSKDKNASSLYQEFVIQIENQLESDDIERIKNGLSNLIPLIQCDPSIAYAFPDPDKLIEKIVSFLESTNSMITTLSTKAILSFIKYSPNFAKEKLICLELGQRLLALFPSHLAIQCFMEMYVFEEFQSAFPPEILMTRFIHIIKNLPTFSPIISSIYIFIDKFSNLFALDPQNLEIIFELIPNKKNCGQFLIKIVNCLLSSIYICFSNTEILKNFMQKLLGIGYKYLMNDALVLLTNVALIDTEEFNGCQILLRNEILPFLSTNFSRYNEDELKILIIDLITILVSHETINSSSEIQEILELIHGEESEAFKVQFSIMKLAHALLTSSSFDLIRNVDPKFFFDFAKISLNASSNEILIEILGFVYDCVSNSNYPFHEAAIQLFDDETFIESINNLLTSDNIDVSSAAENILSVMDEMDEN
ncbi:hypothetical protein TVAG_349990 [Trichomonas vaginalis G3]|uniref:Uncharacterized protein n=1 Tax=Trichomonas vaginalis (strain ATCC PRA-98 / G3) TaxID=412133 RepID=A2FR22_TRIV3|nr:armadillo (ARM) repeat-containing protein family [Trichomonas vaginalis G3]EAX92652.1 hypothetical protein TVAG_349990 [Trichomonas vaginalis G3]KAI5535702.1 armadillo (ARM) repeat-containing protein family [Trichomonas vaginalis G3]|eukprot:XP_001305582.1 hypothetical protein [Trichomonas vaginalis G3]